MKYLVTGSYEDTECESIDEVIDLIDANIDDTELIKMMNDIGDTVELFGMSYNPGWLLYHSDQDAFNELSRDELLNRLENLKDQLESGETQCTCLGFEIEVDEEDDDDFDNDED